MKLFTPRIWAIALAAIGLTLTAQQANAGYIDLTTAGASDEINGAQYIQGSVGSGTGIFPAFVRVQRNGTESGYNTIVNNVFNNTSDDTHNHAVLFSDLAVVSFGGNNYFQFQLDINEAGGGNEVLSLDRLQVYTSTTPNQSTETVGSLGTLQYDSGAGNGALMDFSLASGSGTSDVTVLIPVFTPAAGDLYIYLYSAFGGVGGNFESSDGFCALIGRCARINLQAV